MQMHALMPSHVMLFTRISEEVGLSASLATSIEEHKTMLWNYSRVIHSCYYLESALEVFCLVEDNKVF